jgi:hypothetical protein
MKSALCAIAIGTLAVCACGQARKEAPAINTQEAARNAVTENVAANLDAPVTATEARTEGGIPGEPKASLPKPKGPIDPKSPEAAGQVVQHYGAEIERGRWLKAERLWGDVQSARAFATQIGHQFARAHLEIGKPGEPEGAAGSIYLAMPVVFYGQDKKGNDLRRPAEITLRRVNDVPGSTDVQRRWHIERIEWKAMH